VWCHLPVTAFARPRLPDDLLAAFWRYERALLANDVVALDAAFEPGDSVRTEGVELLAGSEHIAEYRRGRTPPPARRVDRLHLRVIGPDDALVIAEATRPGGRGVQTQLWHRGPAGWRIAAAHVANAPASYRASTAPATGTSSAAPDQATWRTTARPLRPAAGDGPLAGVRIAVKDLFAVAGQRIGAGNPAWLAQAPVEPADAPALAALLAAGAELTGLAQTDELAFSLAGMNIHYGTPPNAAVPGAIPGGSSSGPASAVRSGSADLGLGTDTAGSIRVPASYCGLYGLRPTHGVVSTAGVLALAPSFDTAGLLAADPALLAAAADLLLPPAPAGGPGAQLRELVVAADLVGDPAAFWPAAEAVAGRRVLTVRVIDGLGDLDRWQAAFRTVQTAEAWRGHGPFVTANPGALAPEIEARFRSGAAVTPATEEAARAVLAEAQAALAALLPADAVLAAPATAGPAPAANDVDVDVETTRAATLRLTCLASLSGRPALVLPTLRTGPVPHGLSLMGAPGTDRALLTLLEPGVTR
jgi:Asp-tRNA(Asn)/Glu-tRNA(Gln) amidotransferase A subunit family amidase